ncbi:MAG: phosphatidylcholine/phosphatidylserine synthase [Rickettsiaceae bacterium]|nr:phosphatidylcholine/phosphatidylserine synthase [Rickettsiaceae bacterium]
MMASQNTPRLTILKLLPNFITLLSLIIGITSLQFALLGDWQKAVACVILAAMLDGIDGRVARALNASSNFGAQLDSFCDFNNFGIVPGLLFYLWSAQHVSNKLLLWSSSIFFIICMATRLARFNLLSAEGKSDNGSSKYFFVGVPAPVGGLLALIPIILDFDLSKIFNADIHKFEFYLLLHMFIVGFLLASTLPTFSIKHLEIKPEYVWLIFLLFACIILAIIIYTWYVLPILGLVYLCTIPFSYYSHKKFTNKS